MPQLVLGVEVKRGARCAGGLVATSAGAIASVRRKVNAMLEAIPRAKSRKVNGYVKAVLKLEAVRRKREERYERYVRPLDRQRDVLAAEVATRVNALTGGQHAEARRILGAIPTVNAVGDSGMNYDAPGCAARPRL